LSPRGSENRDHQNEICSEHFLSHVRFPKRALPRVLLMPAGPGGHRDQV